MDWMAIAGIPPGTVLDVDFGRFRHRAIAAYTGVDGKPRLISATLRTGTVLEETWDAVVQGRKVTVISVPRGNAEGRVVVQRARQHIGRWTYDLFSRNCEHFVSMVITGRATSPQLWGAGLSLVAIILGVRAMARG